MWIKVVTGTTPVSTYYHVEEIVRLIAPNGSLGQMAIGLTSGNTITGVVIADWNAGDLLNDDWSVAGTNPMQV